MPPMPRQAGERAASGRPRQGIDDATQRQPGGNALRGPAGACWLVPGGARTMACNPAMCGVKKNAQPVAVGRSRLNVRSFDTFNSVVRLAGSEPTTPWFVAKYSIQLGYSRQARHYRQDFPAAAQVRHFFVAALWRIGARARGRGRRRDGWRSMGGQWAVSGRLIGDPLAAGACPILSPFLQ